MPHVGLVVCVTSFPCGMYLEKRVMCALTHKVHSSLAEDQRSMVRDGLYAFYAKQSCTEKIHVMLPVSSISFSHGTLFTVLLSFVRYEGIS